MPTISTQQATHAVQASPTKKSRRQVEHLFWLDDLEFAKQHNIQTRSFCGTWVTPGNSRPEVVQVASGLVPITDPDDCLRCVRSYQKALRMWSVEDQEAQG